LPPHLRCLLRQARLTRSRGGFEGHAVAVTLQRLDGVPGDPLGVAPVVVVRAEVMVGLARGQHVVDRAEQGVGDGDDSFLVAPVAHDAAIARRVTRQ
jgi:hypothetical protein